MPGTNSPSTISPTSSTSSLNDKTENTKTENKTAPSEPTRTFSPELDGKIDTSYRRDIETYADKVKNTLKSLTANKWLSIALAVIIVLVICALFIFLPKTQVFHQPNPEIENVLKEKGPGIKKEILDQIQTKETRVIPLITKDFLYTDEYPETVELLKEIPLPITYAGIISLKPDFFQAKHYSYGPNANQTYRYFYVIRESSIGCSGVWIDGEKKMFAPNGIICADVSRESCLFNDCVRRNAVVLFFDVVVDRKLGVSLADDIKKDDLLMHFLV